MAILSGDVQATNKLDSTVHAVGAVVIVRLAGEVIGSGEVGEDDAFVIELPDDVAGELEITMDQRDTAPTLLDYNGQDVHIQLIFNNVNNFFA